MTSSSASTGLNQPVVLLVEDNPVNQKLTVAQLNVLGVQSLLANSAESALSLLEDHKVALVLMDRQLGGMDGITAAKLIRDRETAGVHLPIVAMTAAALNHDREECLAAGMDAFLAKPVGLNQLREVLEEWFDVPAKPAADARSTCTHVIDQLLEDMRDHETVITLIDSFLSELPGRTSAIGTAAAQSDFAILGNAAHTLSSTANLLGLSRLGDLCTAFVTAATRGDSADCERLARQLSARSNGATVSLKLERERLIQAAAK